MQQSITDEYAVETAGAIARGHALVIFRDRHVADFTSLTTAEVAAYWRDVHAVARMIERAFSPCHMNYQLRF